eukprot:scaffold147439_cov31-Tisochrysis_lutea.AAC.1
MSVSDAPPAHGGLWHSRWRPLVEAHGIRPSLTGGGRAPPPRLLPSPHPVNFSVLRTRAVKQCFY